MRSLRGAVPVDIGEGWAGGTPWAWLSRRLAATDNPAPAGEAEVRRRDRRRYQGRVTAALGLLLLNLLLLTAAVLAHRAASGWVEHTLEVQLALERLVGAVTDAETAQRGFLLTGDEAFLGPYQDGAARARTLLDQVGRLTADNPDQQARLAELRPEVEERLGAIDLVLRLYRSEGQEPALKTLREHRGTGAMARVHEQVAAMTAEEGRLLDRRERVAQLLYASLAVTLASAIVLALWLPLSGVRRLERDYRAERAEAEALREGEARRRLLLDELRHRVKNTLAVVRGIAAQTLSGERTLGEARNALDRRLQALAETHDLLVAGGMEGARLRELVAAELAPFGGRVDAAGVDVAVGPKTALALTLVLHELATNAAKHGALSTPGGRVELRWAVAHGAERRSLRLIWRERGGPTVREPSRRGFGRTLVEHGAAYELGGRARLEFLSEGVAYTLDVPLDSASPGPLAQG